MEYSLVKPSLLLCFLWVLAACGTTERAGRPIAIDNSTASGAIAKAEVPHYCEWRYWGGPFEEGGKTLKCEVELFFSSDSSSLIALTKLGSYSLDIGLRGDNGWSDPINGYPYRVARDTMRVDGASCVSCGAQGWNIETIVKSSNGIWLMLENQDNRSGFQRRVRLFDIEQRKSISEFDLEDEVVHRRRNTDVAISPNAEYWAYAAANGYVYVFRNN